MAIKSKINKAEKRPRPSVRSSLKKLVDIINQRKIDFYSTMSTPALGTFLYLYDDVKNGVIELEMRDVKEKQSLVVLGAVNGVGIFGWEFVSDKRGNWMLDSYEIYNTSNEYDGYLISELEPGWMSYRELCRVLDHATLVHNVAVTGEYPPDEE